MQHGINYSQRSMIKGITNTRVITGNAIVTAVYQGPRKPKAEEGTDDYLVDVHDLLPGQVKVNLGGRDGNDEPAWVLSPYGRHPVTTGDHNLEQFSMNQSFGYFAMPRVGDKVFVIGTASDDFDSSASSAYLYVFGSVFGMNLHRPPLTDADDVQTLHRSGASIRFNDTYAGGGSIGTDGIESDGSMKGLTGNVTITGNRTMILSGSKYLPHGLLSKYGDPRKPFVDSKIDALDSINDNTPNTVATYVSLFSNVEDHDKFHDPFVEEQLASGSSFLSPPSIDDSIIPLTNNTLLMGKDYQGVGLAGNSTSPNGHDDASGIDEETDEFAIYQIQGARFKVYAIGDVEVWAAPGRNITIKSADGEGKVYLGEGTDAVFRNGDETTTDKDSSTHIGMFGNPIQHTHHGHSHRGVERQSKTFA